MALRTGTDQIRKGLPLQATLLLSELRINIIEIALKKRDNHSCYDAQY